jgi:hypothetical protein
VTFIVNGEETEVNLQPGSPLWLGRIAALYDTGNNGRAPTEWSIYHESGVRLSPTDDCPVGHARLFLCLDAGAGGMN